MSATELFRDCDDAHFRLVGSYLLWKRAPYKVDNVFSSGSYSASNIVLSLRDYNGDCRDTYLDKLPLRVMFDFPEGYIGKTWVCRGMARSRLQGITSDDLWPQGDNVPEDFYQMSIFSKLMLLAQQPRIALPGEPLRRGKPVTNNILVARTGEVLYKGLVVGESAGGRTAKLYDEPSEFMVKDFSRARMLIK